MWGGELFVPKLPSYHILDLLDAISPNSKPKIIGTNNAINISCIFIFGLKQSTKFEYIFLLRITIKKYKIIT